MNGTHEKISMPLNLSWSSLVCSMALFDMYKCATIEFDYGQIESKKKAKRPIKSHHPLGII